MADPKRIISGFRKAINYYDASQVLDLDLKHFEKFDFLALRLEDVFRINTTVPPNQWSFHRIGLITQGKGEFHTNVYKIPAQKYTLVTVPARVLTSSKGWSSDVKGLLLLFNNQFLLRHSTFNMTANKKLLSPYMKPYAYLNDDEAARLIVIFEKLLNEQAHKSEHRGELIALKVLELIIECERIFIDKGNLNKDLALNELVVKFSRLLEKKFQEEHSVSYYASQLNVHANYLNAVIKKHTGETAKEVINNRLLMEVKHLLHSTSLSIKEIAYRTGFSDPNYLTAFFSRMENISAVQYRSLMKVTQS